jgi:hypothetical protein
METPCTCACCLKAKEEELVQWVKGFQNGYAEALLDSLEERLTQPEPVERKPVQEWRN